MLTVSIRRKTFIALLVTVLVTPWASAAGPQPESPRSARTVEPAPLELFSRIWSFLRSVQGKAGCHIDPWGRCANVAAQSPSSQRKEGCHIDPHGRCANLAAQSPSTQTKAGCHIDPFGRCMP